MNNGISNNNTFYKTFSGTDSLAFMLLPDCKPILLGSLTTISYSMYRDKKPVTLIGKVNVSGFTRGMRVIAGSMVFTLINQHISKDLVDQVPYLANHGKIKTDELPLFDIMVISANEYGASTKMMIYGIDVTDDAQVLSIQDLFTENTFNFVARDLDEFTAYKNTVVKSRARGRTALNTVMPYNFDIDSYENMKKLLINNINNEDLVTAQTALVNKGSLYKASGVYDTKTVDAVKKVQLENNLTQTGILDKVTYDLITRKKNDNRDLVVISQNNGAYVYDSKSKSKVNGIANHKESFLGKDDGDFYEVQFFDSKGYILKEDVERSDVIDIKHITEPGIVAIDNGDYSKVGTTIFPKVDMDIKICAVSYYGEEKESFSKYVKVNKNRDNVLTLADISDSYIYNPGKKSKPDRIIFIALSQGLFIYTWDVIIGGD